MPLTRRTLLPVLLATAILPAQEPGDHGHRGFYLSMTFGPAWGDVRMDPVGTTPAGKITGDSSQFEFRVGGALAPGLILSWDMSMRMFRDPSLQYDGSTNRQEQSSMVETLTGAGLTYYFTPSNAFVGVSVGRGRFTSAYWFFGNSSSDQGWGYQVRCGKEWWVSRRWGLGLTAGLVRHTVRGRPDSWDPGFTGDLTATYGYLGFSATFN
jgi:hypothetical protein